MCLIKPYTNTKYNTINYIEVLQKYHFISFYEAMKNNLFNKVMLFSLNSRICQLLYLSILKLYLQFINIH